MSRDLVIGVGSSGGASGGASGGIGGGATTNTL